MSNRHKEIIYMDKLNAHNFWSNPHLLKGEDITYWTNMVNEIGWNNVGALLLMVEYMKMGYSKGMDDEAVMRDIKSYFSENEEGFDNLISNYERYVKGNIPPIPVQEDRLPLEERCDMIQVMAEGLSREWEGKIHDLVGILDDTAKKLNKQGIATWWK